MLPSLLLVGAILPCLALSARSSSSAAEKTAKFSALAKKNRGIVTLDSALFKEITDAPREYSVSVLLTAMGAQYKCAPCQTFAPEHALVAKQWAGQAGHDDHFFAVLDFDVGQDVYQKLGLQTAPNFFLFKPSEGPRGAPNAVPESFDFNRAGFTAEALASYIRGNAGIPLRFTRPVDKTKLLTTVLGTILFVMLTVALWPFLKVGLSQTYLWSGATMVIILLMTSGYMWNQIRHPPYSQPAGNGQTNFVAGGYSNQFGAETHIVAVLYGILAFSAYTLAFTIPKLQDPVRQRLGVYVWTGISIVMLGVLMNLFTMKQGGYPFHFF